MMIAGDRKWAGPEINLSQFPGKWLEQLPMRVKNEVDWQVYTAVHAGIASLNVHRFSAHSRFHAPVALVTFRHLTVRSYANQLHS